MVSLQMVFSVDLPVLMGLHQAIFHRHKRLSRRTVRKVTRVSLHILCLECRTTLTTVRVRQPIPDIQFILLADFAVVMNAQIC